MLWPIIVLGVVWLLKSGSSCRLATPWLDQVTMPTWSRWPDTSEKQQWLVKLAATRDTLECGGCPGNVAFAQAATESGYGQKMASNPWGVRGAGDAGSNYITTKEEFDPGDVKVLKDQKFAKYSSIKAAAAGYVRFTDGKSYRTGRAAYAVDDPAAWLLWLWGMGYATSSSYPATVVAVSRRVALQLDDPSLVIVWAPIHVEIASELSKLAPGKARRARTATLLGIPSA